MQLYEILKQQIGSNAEIGRRFPSKGKARTGQAVGKWKAQGVPEDIALLCHISSVIPYTYNPADYGRNPENLSLVLTKPAC
ncbi:hypothetical protein [Serratia fonticola]|uniref:hypothetical protein n=1 Tax=Serratia fonticola TaxID=47917 RepID=UPI00217835C2|nr:hypothetical protein [Serratia fonticola]CAI1012063.1 Uncharacterised protein [Serratia fonticola]